jgi:hypothetical protein
MKENTHNFQSTFLQRFIIFQRVLFIDLSLFSLFLKDEVRVAALGSMFFPHVYRLGPRSSTHRR